MTELRKDPVLDRWVLVRDGAMARADGECFVCARAAALAPARVGMLPFPEPVLDRKLIVDRSRSAGDLYMRATGAGEHELLVESIAHGTSFAELPVDQLAEVLALYRERLLFLRQDNRFRHMVIIKNQLIDHAYSESFALPMVPPSMRAKIQGIQGYHRRTGSCVYCDMIKAERTEKTLRITESMRHMALAPYASRSPFEMLVLPKGHHADYAESSDQDLADLAALLSELLVRLDRVLPEVSYRFVLETAPPDMGADLQQFHWHFEIHPLVDAPAALWSVVDVNGVSPEDAARRLREAQI